MATSDSIRAMITGFVHKWLHGKVGDAATPWYVTRSLAILTGKLFKQFNDDLSDYYTKTEVDDIITNQLVGTQTWLPAVQTLADLPASVPAANTNYLCRVINDPTAANEGVYQHIASATTAAAWTFFSDNKDWIDEQELAAALPAVIVAVTAPTPATVPALKDGDIWIQYP